MAYSSFSIRSYGQDVKISNDSIDVTNDGLRPILKVFISLNLKLNPTDTDVCYHLQNFMAKLFLCQNENLYLSEVNTSFTEELSIEGRQTGVWLDFCLNDKVVTAIQKYRDNGDVKLMIRFEIAAIFTKTSIESKTIKSLRTETLKGEVQFDIQKSQWVEKLLPKLGHSFKLFEIPLTHNLVQEAYEGIISEFLLAEKYFNQADYNKSIAHCRSTLDKLGQNLKKIKDGTESETAFTWLKKIDSATLTWIDEMQKATSAISSKAHHIGLKKDFTRVEAESIYLVTLGLMNFAGQAHTDFNK